MENMTNDNMDDSETRESRHVIRQDCVSGILILLKKSQELFDEDTEKNKECLVNFEDEIVSAIRLVVNYESETFSEVLDYEEVQELGSTSIYFLKIWTTSSER